MTTTISNTEITNPIISIDIKDYVNEHNIVHFSDHVRVNVNGFPFVTFINGNNKPENFYFSKAASEHYGEGQAIVKGFFENLCLRPTVNANGEERLKLSFKGASKRVGASSVL